MNTLSVVYCDKKLKQPNQRGDTKTQKTDYEVSACMCVCYQFYDIYF